eukprot:Rhum_TRINITY_DN18852_c0_g1::Rhum_TRINITY_DN18852_c0_g1_i1::g.168597::m.168597
MLLHLRKVHEGRVLHQRRLGVDQRVLLGVLDLLPVRRHALNRRILLRHVAHPPFRAHQLQLEERASTDLVEGGVGLARVVAEVQRHRHDVLRLQPRHNSRRHHRGRHPGARNGGDGVAEHVVLGALLSKRLGKAHKTHLGTRVVRLADVAEQAGGGGRAEDTAELLLKHVRPRCLRDGVRALQVHRHDEVPVVVGHLLEAAVAQDAGVVDHDVNAAEVLDRCRHDLLAELDAVVVGRRLAANGADLGDNLVGDAVAVAGRALHGGTQVVDDDAGTAPGQLQGVRLAEALTGSGDDGNAAVKPQLGRHDERVYTNVVTFVNEVQIL